MNNNSKALLEKLQALSKDGGSIIFGIGDYYTLLVAGMLKCVNNNAYFIPHFSFLCTWLCLKTN
jgi:hypothetical protein